MEPISSSLSCPPIERLIAPSAHSAIRDAIADNGGGEVFFVGHVNGDGLVDDVEAYAFGNRRAVPALSRLVRPGDVIIHNHPDGPLDPSDADISIASQMGDLSVGCYIIDNACCAVRVVVRAFREETLHLLDIDEMAGFFGPRGLLARSLPDYEHRPQQVAMARQVARAFNEEGIAVIEAGGGVGKSMAYLLPAILWSVGNRERTVVSTNTINLQEQLIGKDLPLLQQRLGVQFTSELLKGRNNYLCLRKTQYARGERLAQEPPETREQMKAIFEWAEKTGEGSLSELSFVPGFEAWELVMSESDNCLRIKCPFYSRCFFFGARRRAARADVLVVNHHLLMADMALRRETSNYTAAAVLPPFRRVVFDEAHNLEAVATQYFGIRASRLAFTRQLAKLSASKGRGRGILSHLAQEVEKVSSKLPGHAFEQARLAFYLQLQERRDALEEEIRIAFDMVADELLQIEGKQMLKPREEIKRRVTEDILAGRFWRETVAEAVARVSVGVADLCNAAEAAIALLDDLPKQPRKALDSPVMELRSICVKLQDLAGRLNAFYQGGEGLCRWFEVRQRLAGPVSIVFCTAPLEIHEAMREAVYNPSKTVVMTSATLTVGGQFDYFLRQAGLPAADQDGGGEETPQWGLDRRLSVLCLATPFDFESQAFVGVPVDVPDPNQAEFPDSLESLIRRALDISEARAFVLFTSHGLLDIMHRRLQPELAARGWLVLKQGQTNRHSLLEQFRSSPNPALFATSSFWEGVDVKGDALQCVVLTRLPFQVPSEPVLEARVEMIERRGGNSFMELTVPSAVIRFKQGFGRLIRSKNDRGAVLIFDPRIATRRYGTMFLRSLPTQSIHVDRAESIFRGMERFFAAGKRASEGVPG